MCGTALKIFRAGTKSFTAAGHQLNLANSAISKSVARLEDRLGTLCLNEQLAD
uniref:helix-turn-helix domain-containing protein n=1 Tax=Xenorhabdus sp. TH1 TaxID=3130166 RepID=UPI00403FCA4C